VAATVGSAVHAVVVDKGMFADPMDGKNNFLVGMGNVELCSPDFTSNSLHGKDVFYDTCLLSDPKLVSSLEQTKEGTTHKFTEGEFANIGLQDSMRIASSPMADGKAPVFSWTSPITAKSTVSLSLIGCSSEKLSIVSLSLIGCYSEKLSVRPTLEEVIAFGDIPKISLGVRTSKRLGC
jgi:hypothetical protein